MLVLRNSCCGPPQLESVAGTQLAALFAAGKAASEAGVTSRGVQSSPSSPECDTGAGGSGRPPGPDTKVSGEIASCWPTPGLLQSHTPSGEAVCNRASCVALKVTCAWLRTEFSVAFGALTRRFDSQTSMVRNDRSVTAANCCGVAGNSPVP